VAEVAVAICNGPEAVVRIVGHCQQLYRNRAALREGQNPRCALSSRPSGIRLLATDCMRRLGTSGDAFAAACSVDIGCDKLGQAPGHAEHMERAGKHGQSYGRIACIKALKRLH
jgi:hypothetical protein